MILIDTNVLVALVDERDRLHKKAVRDLRKHRGPFGVTSVVLSESCFLLEEGYLRRRLVALLERLPVIAIEPESPWWSDVFTWLDRFAEHTPDLCDALLVMLSSRLSAPIWTYDAEFRQVWRRPDGKPVSLVTVARAGS
ncbi:MAG TPA: PIN domain-containing protein [Polyangiales bacterium]